MSELARAAESGKRWLSGREREAMSDGPSGRERSSMSVLDPVATVVRTELESLRQHALADPGAVDRFVDGRAFPLVEGRTSTFVCRGEADAVQLRHWVYGLPSTPAFTRLDGTDLWYLVLELPSESRVEYKLEVVRGGTVEWIEDPLNPSRARDPFGANSVLHTAGYERAGLDLRRPGGPRPARSSDTSLESQTFGRAWTSASTSRRASGSPGSTRCSSSTTAHDYLRVRVDADGARQPHPPPRDRRGRGRVHATRANASCEYADDERHARFLTEELVP